MIILMQLLKFNSYNAGYQNQVFATGNLLRRRWSLVDIQITDLIKNR